MPKATCVSGGMVTFSSGTPTAQHHPAHPEGTCTMPSLTCTYCTARSFASWHESSARCGTARGVLTCSSNSSTTLLRSAPMNYHKERPTLEGQPAQVAATGLSSGQRRALLETFADKGTHRRKLFDKQCDFLREFWTTGPIWRAST